MPVSTVRDVRTQGYHVRQHPCGSPFPHLTEQTAILSATRSLPCQYLEEVSKLLSKKWVVHTIFAKVYDEWEGRPRSVEVGESVAPWRWVVPLAPAMYFT